MLTVFASGCGSTDGAGGDDALVLQFVQWNSTGITQADEVGQSSADVDIHQGVCVSGMDDLATDELFTETLVNAVFRNNEGSDILLEGYSTQIDDPRLFQANITNGSLSTNITGGRCSVNGEKCALDSDCRTAGTCLHTETTVSGIVLISLQGKSFIEATIIGSTPPALDILGRTIPLKVTFFGSDPNRSFQITINYMVTFANFDNCMTSTGGGAGPS